MTTSDTHHVYAFNNIPVVAVVFCAPNENADDAAATAGVPNVNVGAVDLLPKKLEPSDVPAANVILYIYIT